MSIRIGKLEKQIRLDAKAKFVASVNADFELAMVRAAANDSAIKLLSDARAVIIRAGTKFAEEQALDEFLAAKAPLYTPIDIFNPPMVKLDGKGEPMPDDQPGHVAVLLPTLGIMYDARKPEKKMNWAEAVKAGSECRLFDATDWQLWSRKEAELTIKTDRHSPATDTNFFPGTPRDWFWTRDSYAPNPSSNAWFVYFSGGDVNWSLHGNNGFSRACRRAPAPAKAASR